MDLPTTITLLCKCLSIDIDETTIARLKQLSISDWQTILQHSDRHGITPLLYQRLQTSGIGSRIPTDILLELRKRYLYNAGKNMRLYHELSKVLTVLQKEDVPVIILKGAHLAEIVYGNIALRSMSDVDLLVKRQDFARSQQSLIRAGYFPRDRRFISDIQWSIENLLPDLTRDIKKIWERAQPAVIAEVKVLVLSSEDLILHLCLHIAFHHLFQAASLKYLCDIQEAIRYYSAQIQWEQVWNRAREWGICNAVYLTLLLARDIIGARVPDDFIEELRSNRFDPQLKTWAMQKIFHEPSGESSLSLYFWQLWEPGPFREKLIAFRKLLFPSPESLTRRYPVSLGSIQNYLYYFVRLKDHVIPYVHALWRLLSRDKEMILESKQQNRDIAMREKLLKD
jgi:hypothetical protein